VDIQTNYDVLTQIAEYSIRLQKEKPTIQYAGQKIIRKCHLAIIQPAGFGNLSWLAGMEDKHPGTIVRAFTQASLEGCLLAIRETVAEYPGLYQEDAIIAITEPLQHVLESRTFMLTLDGLLVCKSYPYGKIEYMPQATIWLFLQPRKLPEGLKRRMTIVNIANTHYDELMRLIPRTEVTI